jgi:putative flippase GtrA
MSARQPIRFVTVGAAGYAANVAMFTALHAADVPYVTASVIAYLIANALMYVANRHFTFGAASTGFWSGFLRYGLVGMLVAALNAATLAALVRVAGLAPTPGAAISVILITPVAFVLFRRIVFSDPPSGRSLTAAPPAT